MMMSALLKFILLSCGWFLFFAGHSFYRCVDGGFSVVNRRNLRFYRGYVALCNLKNEYMLFIGNRNALPCSITGNDL